MTPQAALAEGLDLLSLPLPEGASAKLLRYVDLLGKWNKTYNLTAIRDPREIVTHHLLDCLAVVPHLPGDGGATLADVGSGAGLPGVPLAIALPAWRVTVNDSSAKKAAFLRQVRIDLGLDNMSVHEGRVQSWSVRDRFGVVISRAFSALAQFIVDCRHLVGASGTLAAMKGAPASEELGAVPADCDCSRVIRLKVPLLEAQRQLVLCRIRR